ncbi:MAG: hypothetical protein Fur0034_05200 [Desulfuromonadia bacterium]
MIVTHANHLAQSGHQVTIMTTMFDSVFALHPRVHLVTGGHGSKLNTLLKGMLTRFDHDVIVADIIVMAAALATRNRRNIMYFAQDYDESYYSSPILKLFIRLVYRFAFSLLEIRTIVVSSHLQSLFQQKYHAASFLCENGIDTSRFYPDREKIENDSDRTARVLLLARSDHRKGFDVARNVIKNLEGYFDRLEIWTVGEMGLIHDAPIPCRDFGYVPEETLRKIMSSVDLFLYPSRHEGLPLMPLEAMACGCPVVTTTAVPYAREGENSLVAPIGDVQELAKRVIRLVESESLRSEMGRKGIEFARHYSLERCCRTFEQILLDSVSTHG